ncbi:restriction endonuclease subunit S [Flavobacterium sp.]|uniref:restriction endonuclease subunit S n=1 Tax=Flavobacterium sp. TaxID=239 RepID=UPI0025EBA409|nr:restriction endonuclease subunit S [Flavobacterium sp.]
MSLMRINDLFHFEKGSLQSSKCTEGEFDFITASSEWKTHNEYTHNCEALVFAAAASGSLGRTHYLNGKFIASDLCFVITPKDPINFPIDLKFYHMIFNEFKDDIVKNTKAGTSKEAIGLKSFGNYKLPYFQIDKQVETKNQFVKMQSSKIDLNSELTHQLDLIIQLRQAFLREAMQGKLVSSETLEVSSETGHDLLAKIKAEKAQLIAEKKLKKEKELPPITNEEIPFEIPEHWAWCRLGEICLKITDGTHHSPTNTQSGEYKYVTAKNIKDEGIDLSNITYVNEKVHKEIFSRCNPEKGDILYIKDGATTGIVTINNLDEEYSMLSSVALLKLSNSLFNKYLMYSMRSPFYYQATRNEMYGVAITRVTLEKIKNAIIPLPPLNEQEQIVAKLEELMTFCDGLEKSIKESQRYNELLLQQVLREALQGKEEV